MLLPLLGFLSHLSGADVSVSARTQPCLSLRSTTGAFMRPWCPGRGLPVFQHASPPLSQHWFTASSSMLATLIDAYIFILKIVNEAVCAWSETLICLHVPVDTLALRTARRSWSRNLCTGAGGAGREWASCVCAEPPKGFGHLRNMLTSSGIVRHDQYSQKLEFVMKLIARKNSRK